MSLNSDHKVTNIFFETTHAHLFTSNVDPTKNNVLLRFGPIEIMTFKTYFEDDDKKQFL